MAKKEDYLEEEKKGAVFAPYSDLWTLTKDIEGREKWLVRLIYLGWFIFTVLKRALLTCAVYSAVCYILEGRLDFVFGLTYALMYEGLYTITYTPMKFHGAVKDVVFKDKEIQPYEPASKWWMILFFILSVLVGAYFSTMVV